jgi:energy-converting hydrogenase Eha subunit C
MEILFLASAVLNILGGIAILLLLKNLKESQPPF